MNMADGNESRAEKRALKKMCGTNKRKWEQIGEYHKTKNFT